MPEPHLKRIDAAGITDRYNLNTATIQILCVPAQSEPPCLIARRGAKEHTLHLARDDETACRHDYVCGLGPPAAAIAPSISLAVTGPRNCLTTLPSGDNRYVIGNPRGVGKSCGGL